MQRRRTNKDPLILVYAVTSPHADVFELAILTTVTLASTRIALPDDGVTDCTETYRRCFNVNSNENFKILLEPEFYI